MWSRHRTLDQTGVIVNNMFGKLSATNVISILQTTCRFLGRHVKLSGMQEYFESEMRNDNGMRQNSTMIMLRSIRSSEATIFFEKSWRKQICRICQKNSNVLIKLIKFLKLFEKMSLKFQEDLVRGPRRNLHNAAIAESSDSVTTLRRSIIYVNSESQAQNLENKTEFDVMRGYREYCTRALVYKYKP